MADWPYSTTTWKRLRALKLASAPLCEPCRLRGRTVQARVVDHVAAIKAGGPPFPGLDGLMSMCDACHNWKTASVDRAGGTGVALKGGGLDGLPVDPSHPFYGGHAIATGDRAGERAERPSEKPFRARRLPGRGGSQEGGRTPYTPSKD